MVLLDAGMIPHATWLTPNLVLPIPVTCGGSSELYWSPEKVQSTFQGTRLKPAMSCKLVPRGPTHWIAHTGARDRKYPKLRSSTA